MKLKKTVIIDFIILGLISAFYIALYWQKWCDPISDFGRELYVAWRINQGEVLYRDLAFLFGAFPPYWNALLFKIFGPSILTLVLFNTFITLCDAALIYRFFYKTCGRFTAFVTAAAFLVLFAFNFSSTSRLMNYLAPYSHSNFYALFFAFCALNLFQTYTFQKKTPPLFFLGTCLGLMMLSRLEIFVMFFAPLAAGMIVFFIKTRSKIEIILRDILLTAGGGSLPVLVFLIYFKEFYSLPDASLKIISYNPLWPKIIHLHLYRNLAGYTNFSANLKSFGMNSLWYLFLFLSLHILFSSFVKLRRNGPKVETRIMAGTCAAFMAATSHLLSKEYTSFERSALVLIPGIVILYVHKILDPLRAPDFPKNICLLILGIWSFFMALKLPLNFVLADYGLIYCLPGTLFWLVFLFKDYPDFAQHQYQAAWAARSLLLSCLVFVFLFTIQNSISHATWKTVSFGEGNNHLKIFDYRANNVAGKDIVRFTDWARRQIKPGETFVVLPDGAMFNFLLRHPLPIPYESFMPAETLTFSEEKMLESIYRSPPDYFIINHRQKLAYGDLVVGMTCNIRVFDWVRKNYTRIWESGINNKISNFGIQVYQKNGELK